MALICYVILVNKMQLKTIHLLYNSIVISYNYDSVYKLGIIISITGIMQSNDFNSDKLKIKLLWLCINISFSLY